MTGIQPRHSVAINITIAAILEEILKNDEALFPDIPLNVCFTCHSPVFGLQTQEKTIFVSSDQV